MQEPKGYERTPGNGSGRQGSAAGDGRGADAPPDAPTGAASGTGGASLPRTNRERTETTRRALMEAARALFVDKGYAGTSTPEIAAAAGLTRGALYHHFADKQALFRAVVDAEARAVAGEIERAAPDDLPIRRALLAGSAAYLGAMAVAGRTRLLLVEGPAVLGAAGMRAIDEAHAARTLKQGLEAALGGGDDTSALADLVAAAFDRAALAIQDGGDPARYRAAMIRIVERLLGPAEGGGEAL